MSPFATCGHDFFSKGILNYVHQYPIVCMIALNNAKHNWSLLLTEITVKVFQGCFKGASMVFKAFYKGGSGGISLVFQGVLWVF